MNKKIILASVFLFLIGLKAYCEGPSIAPTHFYLYVGAYTDNDDEGISIYQFDAN